MAGDRASGKAWRIKTPSPGKGIGQGSAICLKLVSEEKIHCVVVGAPEMQLPFFKMAFNALRNEGFALACILMSQE